MPCNQCSPSLCFDKTISVVNIDSKKMYKCLKLLKQRLLVALDKWSSGNLKKNNKLLFTKKIQILYRYMACPCFSSISPHSIEVRDNDEAILFLLCNI